MGLSRVDLFASIRRDKRLDPGLSQRALAEKYGVHRRTVKQALESALPPPRKTPKPRVTVLEPAKAWIDARLREDLTAPRNQKHTARRIQQRLAQEYDFELASYSTICDYVAARRTQIEMETRADTPTWTAWFRSSTCPVRIPVLAEPSPFSFSHRGTGQHAT